MDIFKTLGLDAGRAICYSGYRRGQSPDLKIYPSYEQIREDLNILKDNWKYLRLYDCSQHAETVLEVITREHFPFKVMLGAFIHAEMNNFGCPWGGVYPEETLNRNRENNLLEIRKLIHLANQYPDIVFSLSAGNEATVDWTDHYVPVERVIEYVRMIKRETIQPVTFCENYVPWHHKLETLVPLVDFISIHSYPVWEYKRIHEALEYTRQNLEGIASKYPGKPVAITEAGWATHSNGRGIDPDNVSEANQEVYIRDLLNWSERENILSFVFEAFDEPWKGSPEAFEPEKHWGLYKVDRQAKQVVKSLFMNTCT